MANLPGHINPDVLLPWSAALEVVEPALLEAEPSKTVAIGLFKKHVADMDVELSIRQLAWCWDNFLSVLMSRVPARSRQWMREEGKSAKNPFALMHEFASVQKALYVTPAVNQMEKSIHGKIFLKGFFAFAYLFDFVALLVIFNYIGSGLVSLRNFV